MGLFDEAIRKTEEASSQRRKKQDEKPTEEVPPRLQLETFGDFDRMNNSFMKVQVNTGLVERFDVDEVGLIYPGRDKQTGRPPAIEEILKASLWLSSASREASTNFRPIRVDRLKSSVQSVPFEGVGSTGLISMGALIVAIYRQGLSIRTHKHCQGFAPLEVLVPSEWETRLHLAKLDADRKYPLKYPRVGG